MRRLVYATVLSALMLVQQSAGASPARPDPGLIHGAYLVDYTVYNECTGEMVHVSGTMNYILKFSLENGIQKAIVVYWPADLTAVGETSGSFYRVRSHEKIATNGGIVAGQFMWNITSMLQLSLPGKGNQFRHRFTDQFMWSATDVNVVDRIIHDTSCN
ncbi:MAG TPA: hypothetical protein VFZ78_02700 [Flavisolibacter sp.]